MRIVKSCVFVLLAAFLAAAAAAPEPKTEEQKTLYAVGLAISRSVSVLNLSPADLEMVKAGLTDGVLKKTPKVDIDAYRPKIAELQTARLATLKASPYVLMAINYTLALATTSSSSR